MNPTQCRSSAPRLATLTRKFLWSFWGGLFHTFIGLHPPNRGNTAVSSFGLKRPYPTNPAATGVRKLPSPTHLLTTPQACAGY
ncbi:MAG: hypothetical protein HC804_10700 [Anaerolineae bacterium]|nr:hypothetical protein [Anaerolineae bacterium]